MTTRYASLDLALGEEIDQLRRTVERFAEREIASRAAQIDRDDSFPRALWPMLGDLGHFGLTVATEYGGSGFGFLAHIVAMAEISRASAAAGLSYGAHSNLCVDQIRRNGSEAQKDRNPCLRSARANMSAHSPCPSRTRDRMS